MNEFVVAVDVGTGSARAGVFDAAGHQLARAVTPFSLFQPEANHYEQVSDEIWQAVVASVKRACSDAGAGPNDIAAIGFDATCSLVVRDHQGLPVTVSRTADDARDTLLWMDHRAIAEAEECSLTRDPLLGRFGGRISPEMQVPKLMWLKRHLPESWNRAAQIFDLCDYLTWKATGSTARSHSPLSSKWGYEPQAPGARPDHFYQQVGLDDLESRAGAPDFSHPLSKPIGNLSPDAAAELALTTNCVVAPGLIDAYAGAMGAFCGAGELDFTKNAALVAGTSSCIIRFFDHQIEHPGCWGGFRDAGLPGLWLMEAGQSSSGALLDHVLRIYSAGAPVTSALHLKVLNHIAEQIAATGPDYGLPIHVLPDFHGARSPVSDASLTGTFAGLTLDMSFDGLCKLYWRTCVSLACGIRHALENMPQSEAVTTLLMTGGFANHPLIPELYANVTGKVIRINDARDVVLLGTAVHAGLATGRYADISSAAEAISRSERMVVPNAAMRDVHEQDYAVYHAMSRHRAELAGLRPVR